MTKCLSCRKLKGQIPKTNFCFCFLRFICTYSSIRYLLISIMPSLVCVRMLMSSIVIVIVAQVQALNLIRKITHTRTEWNWKQQGEIVIEDCTYSCKPKYIPASCLALYILCDGSTCKFYQHWCHFIIEKRNRKTILCVSTIQVGLDRIFLIFSSNWPHIATTKGK